MDLDLVVEEVGAQSGQVVPQQGGQRLAGRGLVPTEGGQQLSLGTLSPKDGGTQRCHSH